VTEQKIRIDPLSATSLYLKLYVNGHQLSTATGFVIEHDGKAFLISNRHVFSGRHAETNEPLSSTAALPDEVRIAHHIKGKFGEWRFHGEPLQTLNGTTRWLEHPSGCDVDVAALELSNIKADTQIYPFDLALAQTDLIPEPAMPVSVIGFPLGLRPNVFFPIWKTGHIATDPDLPYGGRPAFLIDATTRNGMSGSPVVVRMSSGYQNAAGMRIFGADIKSKFLGVYSARIHDEVEIGCVWRPTVISEILNGRKSNDT